MRPAFQAEFTGRLPHDCRSPAQVAIHLNSRDNVAVAARSLSSGMEVQLGETLVKLAGHVGLGHKIALRDIKRARRSTSTARSSASPARTSPPGDHVHVHNVARRRLRARLRLLPRLPAAAGQPAEPRYFHGLRPRRRPATARATTSPSSAPSTARPAPASTSPSASAPPTCSKQYPNVDGVVAITHKAGCAMQYDGPDHNQLDRTLAGFAKHPNVAAYILVGLGCETGQAIHLDREPGA